MATLNFTLDRRRSATRSQPERVETPAAASPCRAKVLKPAQVENWQSSSFDLQAGLQVCDVSDTIPGRVFAELFKTCPRFRG